MVRSVSNGTRRLQTSRLLAYIGSYNSSTQWCKLPASVRCLVLDAKKGGDWKTQPRRIVLLCRRLPFVTPAHRNQRHSQSIRVVPVGEPVAQFEIADKLQPLQVLRMPGPAELHLDGILLRAGLNDLRFARFESASPLDDAQRRFERFVVQIAGPAELRVVRIAEPIEIRVEQIPVGVGDRGAKMVERIFVIAPRFEPLALDIGQFCIGTDVFGRRLFGDLDLELGQRRTGIRLQFADQVVSPQKLLRACGRLGSGARKQRERRGQWIGRPVAERDVALLGTTCQQVRKHERSDQHQPRKSAGQKTRCCALGGRHLSSWCCAAVPPA